MTCQLLPEMMTARLEACQRLLSRYESEGNDFLYSIVTGDGSWMRHYDPELKSQSLEYRHPLFPERKQSKTRSSAGKRLLIVPGQGYDDGLGDSGEDPKEVEERITRVLQRKTPKLLQHDDVRPRAS